ncbi:hypothetical protein NQ318_001170 [Aromia moschata]|uniref:DUF4817 domain-containing protein n=1 Tax=Aromia moschata TaxID=1265417 RepID=A0AAV8ZEE9_9CUCU|nr:hypothetical protein NQ318_001170 [Aromia moschata]
MSYPRKNSIFKGQQASTNNKRQSTWWAGSECRGAAFALAVEKNRFVFRRSENKGILWSQSQYMLLFCGPALYRVFRIRTDTEQGHLYLNLEKPNLVDVVTIPRALIDINCLLSVLKMAGKFSFSEQVDMLLVLDFCEANCRRSVEEYRRRFPNRVIPHRETFSNVETRARETSKFFISTRERAIATKAQDEEPILNTIEDEPHINIRNLSRQTGILQNSVHQKILRHVNF